MCFVHVYTFIYIHVNSYQYIYMYIHMYTYIRICIYEIIQLNVFCTCEFIIILHSCSFEATLSPHFSGIKHRICIIGVQAYNFT